MRFRRNIKNLSIFWENFMFDKTLRLFDITIDIMLPNMHPATHQMFYEHVLEQVIEETMR